MRLLLVALAACGSSDEECVRTLFSDVTNQPRGIVSGRDVIGAAWAEHPRDANETLHATVFAADGSHGSVIELPWAVAGAAGTRTVNWHSALGPSRCTQAEPSFEAALQRADGVTYVHVYESAVRGRGVVFDGTQYQVFWTTIDNQVQHRTLSEDGALGPIDVITPAAAEPGSCIDAATDGAGTTVVRDRNRAFVLEATGPRKIFEGPNTFYTSIFYWDGRFHVDDLSATLRSFDTAGQTTTRELPFPIQGASEWFPGVDTMFVRMDSGQIVEVDRNLEIVHKLGSDPDPIGSFGPDFVFFRRVAIEEFSLTPGRLTLVRNLVWETPVAIDSDVQSVCAANGN